MSSEEFLPKPEKPNFKQRILKYSSSSGLSLYLCIIKSENLKKKHGPALLTLELKN